MAATNRNQITQVRLASVLNVLAGLWLIIAPFGFGYALIEIALWNSVLAGAAVAVLAILRVVFPLKFERLSWINFCLGLWLMLSPFSLGFYQVGIAAWNTGFAGLIITLLAAWSDLSSRGIANAK